MHALTLSNISFPNTYVSAVRALQSPALIAFVLIIHYVKLFNELCSFPFARAGLPLMTIYDAVDCIKLPVSLAIGRLGYPATPLRDVIQQGSQSDGAMPDAIGPGASRSAGREEDPDPDCSSASAGQPEDVLNPGSFFWFGEEETRRMKLMGLCCSGKILVLFDTRWL